MRGGAFVALLGVALLLVSPQALARDEVVDVVADVVHVSNHGEVLDPPSLAEMKKVFAQKGLSFTSFRRLSSERVSLQPRKPRDVGLPNKKTATLQFLALKEGAAQVRVTYDKSVKVDLTLGREGSLYVNVGEHDGGQLVLVLSPVMGHKGRRMTPRSAGSPRP